MHIHILGICGTFMGGVALMARELGHEVSGCDANVYPPMSDALTASGISVHLGYDPAAIHPKTDLVIIGNTVPRQNSCVEHVLNQNINYTSGAQWMGEHVLRHQHVLAVSGTHGKTTTTALLTWILETAGLNPGFLIGGVAKNFSQTSRLGGEQYFVIEADEYDTAFFDKRSKFLHYRPKTLIINNIEFDHADIFSDLEAIKKQFHYLLRTVPGNGLVIFPSKDAAIEDVLSRGLFSKQTITCDSSGWHEELLKPDGSAFTVFFADEKRATIQWSLIGNHNIQNALSAIAAADSLGVSMRDIEKAFRTFHNVKRRLEVRGCVNKITVYDDFAHHPTAISTTIRGLRARVGTERIILIAQLGSNSMRMGAYQDTLAPAFDGADEVHVLQPEDKSWDIVRILKPLGNKAFVHESVSDIINCITKKSLPHDHLLVMSNKGFDGIHERLLDSIHCKIVSVSAQTDTDTDTDTRTT